MCSSSLSAQIVLEGIVFDKETKNRMGEVLVYNLKTKYRQFNNHKGEFRILANKADTLVFLKEGYFSDTVVVSDKNILMISMLKDYTLIETVDIFARRSPEVLREQRKAEHKDAYRLAAPKDFVSTGPGGMGAGISIDYLYGLVSREGRNARRFTAYLDRLYEEDVIDAKFTPELVKNVTGLDGERLKNFVSRYRPTYDFVIKATSHEMAQYIRSKYNIFMVMPDIPVTELPKIQMDVHKQD